MESPFGARGARLGGYVVDLCLIYFAEIVGSFLGGVVAASMAGTNQPREISQQAAANGMLFGWIFWGAVAWLMNYGVLQGMTGASLGKMTFGLRVVNQDGSPIGISKAIGRSLCYVASALPLYFGFIAIFWNKKNQCWHDSICRTVVIRKNARYPAMLIEEQIADAA